jgi:hypothetical protein
MDGASLDTRQNRARAEAVASNRLGDRRRRVCCLAGLLSVWLNLVLAVLLPLAHGTPAGPSAAGTLSATIALSSSATLICTREGVKWIDADGNQVPAPPQHQGGLCPFCLPLTGGGVMPPSESLVAVVEREGRPADYVVDPDRLAAVPSGNPAARPRAPPSSVPHTA